MCIRDSPHAYGRVFLKGDFVERIVEEKDCNDLERENPLINAGIYCFNWGNLSEIINTSDGPANESMPTSPNTCLFASAT